jgi:phosphoribosylformylglycinamidine synthase
MTTDGNPWYVALDPYTGTMAAVAEAARNIVCTGARPLALTNCLNFGNPERPQIFWQLEESIRGLGDASRTLGVPVVSGNVSLYNETDGRNILPTPVIGMLGMLDDLDRRCQAGFQAEGDLIFLLGDTREELDGSEYSRLLRVPLRGSVPRVDLEAELHLQQGLLAAIADGVLHSAHDLAEGGLLIALAECVLLGGLGARCPALRGTNVSPAAVAFGESQGRVLVTVEARRVPDLQAIMLEHHVPVQAIGVVGGEELRTGAEIRCSIERLREAWDTPW